MTQDEKFMSRCFELALMGLGKTAPNPLVGCVIVNDNKVVADGYHEEFGKAHAEVNAINALPPGYDFSNSSLYVNLEPCSHFGKTPPCVNLIIEKKIKRVIISNQDSNPLVAGTGIKLLKEAGIEVVTRVLEEDGYDLNKRFFTYHTKKRPYVVLKWAQTSNGLISRWPQSDRKEDNWITGEESTRLVHVWRSEEQAIMVGTNTVINDDPELTVRYVGGYNPTRIVLDRELKLKTDLNVFNGVAKTIVFTEKEKGPLENVKYIKTDFREDLKSSVLNKLYDEGILSVFVEGGAKLLNSFIDQNQWDEIRIIKNPNKSFVNGIKAPNFEFKDLKPLESGSDELYLIKNSL